MRLLPQDERFLHRSLALAEDAAAFASPNPTVGCVLVKDHIVLGEGAHRYDLRDHAEIDALKAATVAGNDVLGATAYVTLEPCSHHGRTGPCADALIAANIARCVVCTVDPNPLVSGSGLRKLGQAQIAIHLLDPLSPEAKRARRLNDAFAFSVQHGRPFVTLKTAVSQDGKIAPPPAARIGRAPFWLTGVAAREDVQLLRHASDAILTGVGTVLADDPSLTDRTGLPRRKPLMRVVLDADLRTPLESTLVQSAEGDLLLIAGGEAPREREAELKARGAQVLRLRSRTGRLDLDEAMAALAAMGLRSVLVEAGSTLNEALLEHGLIDKVVVYTAPVSLGENALPFARNVSVADLQASLTSESECRLANGDAEDLRRTGYLHDPWSGIAGS